MWPRGAATCSRSLPAPLPARPGFLGGEEGGGGSLTARSVSCLDRSCVLSRAWPSLAGGQLGGQCTNIKPIPRTGWGGRVRFQTSVCSPGKALDSHPNPNGSAPSLLPGLPPGQPPGLGPGSWERAGQAARRLGAAQTGARRGDRRVWTLQASFLLPLLPGWGWAIPWAPRGPLGYLIIIISVTGN